MEDTIALQKAELRKAFHKIRASANLKEKNEKDNAITKNIANLPEFQACQVLMTYVSIHDEVNTRKIINVALKNGKRVAVPRTIPDEKVMEFYKIKSLDELKPGRYGILEPDADPAKKASDTLLALCLVPGLSFDGRGNRLGYGGGYYDRFLKDFSGASVGLCRTAQISEDDLTYEANDVRVKLIVTENGVKRLDVINKNVGEIQCIR